MRTFFLPLLIVAIFAQQDLKSLKETNTALRQALDSLQAAEVSVGGDCYVKICRDHIRGSVGLKHVGCKKVGSQVIGTIYQLRGVCFEALTGCNGCLSEHGVNNKPNDLKSVTCPAQECSDLSPWECKKGIADYARSDRGRGNTEDMCVFMATYGYVYYPEGQHCYTYDGAFPSSWSADGNRDWTTCKKRTTGVQLSSEKAVSWSKCENCANGCSYNSRCYTVEEWGSTRFACAQKAGYWCKGGQSVGYGGWAWHYEHTSQLDEVQLSSERRQLFMFRDGPIYGPCERCANGCEYNTRCYTVEAWGSTKFTCSFKDGYWCVNNQRISYGEWGFVAVNYQS